MPDTCSDRAQLLLPHANYLNSNVVQSTLEKVRVHIALGDALGVRGGHEAALKHYGEAVRLARSNGQGHALLGKTLLRLRRFSEAARSCARAIQLGHVTPGAWSNLGTAQQALVRHEEAVVSFRSAAELLPDSAVLLSNLGNALIYVGCLEEARAVCERAITLDPGLIEAQVNLGRAFYHAGQRDAAVACYRQALVLRPNLAEVHTHLGIALLALGQFTEGWAHYEHRLRRPGALAGWQPVQAGKVRPLWDGAPLPGRTLLVIAEQGNGDIIQFARYLPMVRELCGRVVFRVPRRLAALLGGMAEISPDDVMPPHFDAWCPLLSLPHRLGTTMVTIPAATPYLQADPIRVERWRHALPQATLRVGIAWQGNPAHSADKGRSTLLKNFTPLSDIPGVQLVSLQKGFGAEQANEPRIATLVHQIDKDFDSDQNAFLDTAAILPSLDLVITTDTAIAHLAGALNCPTWVVLKKHAEWRWLSERTDTPWYPSLRLFRQVQEGDWEKIMDQLVCNLRTLAEGRPSSVHDSVDTSFPVENDPGFIMVPMSPGDLIDRIAILEVKAGRIADVTKQTNVLRELNLLRQARQISFLDWSSVNLIEQQLQKLHNKLWDIENMFRGCDKQRNFGKTFTTAARAVISLNMRRADLKRLINKKLNSSLQEEKSYE